MKKSNIFGRGDKRKVNPDWFTNKTWMKVLSTKIKSKDQDIYHVHFEKGSRTKIHFHNGNQVLIGVKGKGSLEIFRRYGSSKTNFNIKKIEKSHSMRGILYTFQQRHSIHMVQLIRKRHFLILQ